MAFLLPLIGFILSIIALTQVKKNHQKGQGLAIAGIIISVLIGVGVILIALVATTFTGVQAKARDTERQTDIKILHTQVEGYYAKNAIYPTLENLNDGAWLAT